MTPYFLFATGIENSCPTIDGGRTRFDEMEACGHYDRWREDFDLVEDLGVRFLRYGLPLHLTWKGEGRYDWEFADAAFSAAYGWWNEQLANDRAFVTALEHLAMANIRAMHAILKVRPDALFIQSESSEYFHAANPRAIGPAEFLNARRFLSLDLNYGRRVDSAMYEFLLDNGMTREEYHAFLTGHLKHHCVMGNDYYVSNEHRVEADGRTSCAGEVFGYDEITRQYYERYRLPVMHTETNLMEGPKGDESVYWLWKEWANVLRLRNGGIPIVGFTWYSLTDQVDWDVALREKRGVANPLGLYDLDRNIRAVGRAYKELIREWREVLPTQSVCLRMPLVPPSEHGTRVGRQSRVDAESHAATLARPPTSSGGDS